MFLKQSVRLTEYEMHGAVSEPVKIMSRQALLERDKIRKRISNAEDGTIWGQAAEKALSYIVDCTDELSDIDLEQVARRILSFQKVDAWHPAGYDDKLIPNNRW